MSSSILSKARLLAALRAFCLLLLGLHLLAPLLTEEAAWGVWPFTYLGPGWRWLLAGLAALASTPLAAQVVRRAFSRLSGITRRGSREMLFAIIPLLSIIPFSLFRIVHTRWGDAYLLINGIAFPDPALRITATWQAPLDVWLHGRLWLLGNRLWGWADAWPVYRLLSPLAGALYVYVVLRLADSSGRNRTEKLVIVGLMGTLGTMQLFFGYPENYVLAAAGIVLFLWLALESLDGRRALWQPALALAVTHGLHPSTVVLAPALLYVAWHWARQEQSSAVNGRSPQPGWSDSGGPARGRRGWRALWQVAVPMVVVATGVIGLMTVSGHGLETLLTSDRPGGGDARWFVPLTQVTTRWEHYTMFSWPHLRDWLNEQLLTAPVTLGGLIILGVALLIQRAGSTSAGTSRLPRDAAETMISLRTTSKRWVPPEIVFLALCTALYWLFTWVWNPDYGGQRDWDLFSLAALPSTLLLARLLPLALPRRSQLAQAGLMLTAVSAVHTVAWVYQNTLPWEWR